MSYIPCFYCFKTSEDEVAEWSLHLEGDRHILYFRSTRYLCIESFFHGRHRMYDMVKVDEISDQLVDVVLYLVRVWSKVTYA